MSHSVYNKPIKPGFLGAINWKAPGIGLLIVLAANQWATQYVAYQFGFSPQLGVPICTLLHHPVYQPFAWVVWLFTFWQNDAAEVQSVLKSGLYIAGAGMLFALIVTAFLNLYHNRKLLDNTEHLHGSARWATEEDLIRNGLLTATKGVYIGAWKTKDGTLKYLKHNGPEHVFTYAPTRSGKGVSLIIPTLLSWEGSTLVLDLKGENWEKTSGFRSAAGQECWRFAPAEPDRSKRGIRFNPLNEVRVDTDQDVSDAQTIAKILCEKGTDSTEQDDYFRDGAEALLVGLILHVCYRAKREKREPTLAEIRANLSPIIRANPDSTGKMPEPWQLFKNHLESIRDLVEHDGYIDGTTTWINDWKTGFGESTRFHPAVMESIQNMLVRADREFSGVHGCANKALRLYLDPIVAYSVSGSDFRIHDLVMSKRPVSLYVVVPPLQIDRLKPLLRLLFTLITERLTEDHLKSKSYKHKLLLMLDECPQLGYMKVIGDSLSYIGGYGLKAYVITQDRNQLTRIYGEKESVSAGCEIKISFSANDDATAQAISKELGKTTVQHAQLSYSGSRTKSVMTSVSQTVQLTERPLLTPDEVRLLPKAVKSGEGDGEKIVKPGAILVTIAGMHPILGTQLLYFKDKELLRRSDMPPTNPRGTKPPVQFSTTTVQSQASPSGQGREVFSAAAMALNKTLDAAYQYEDAYAGQAAASAKDCTLDPDADEFLKDFDQESESGLSEDVHGAIDPSRRAWQSEIEL